MERRKFLRTCALAGGAVALASREPSFADVAPHYYAKTRLVDIHGAPIGVSALAEDTNFIFNYPYAATPCFLLKLGRSAAAANDLRREDGATYAWQGGVGADRNVVAFSAICAHKLAYPTRDVSFIRFQKDRSATSTGNVIHCCADHSVYDPAAGARVVATAGSETKVAVCRAMGADVAINYKEDDFVALVKEATDGRGADVIYDPVGGDVFDRSTKCIAFEGRIVVVGFTSGRMPSVAANHVLIKNYSVVGLHWGMYRQRAPELIAQCTEELLRLYEAGKIRPHVGQQAPLAEAVALLQAVAARQTTGKAVLTVTS